MMVLRHIGAGGTGVHPLRGPMAIVGSAEDADIRIEEPGLPEAALRLEPSDGGARLTVLAGGQRIRVNGREPGPGNLAPGDRLELGSQVLILDHAEAAPAAGSGSGAGMDAEAGAGERRALQLREVLEVFSRLTAEQGELQKVIDQVLAVVARSLGATEGFLFTLDEQGEPRVCASAGSGDARRRFSDTLVQAVLREGRGLALPHALEDPRFSGAQSIVDLKLQTVLAAPIRLAGRTIGLIYLGCRRAGVSYTEADLAVLEVYASLAGMLIHSIDYIGQQRESIRRLTAAADDGLITQSPVLENLLEQMRGVAPSEITVLIQGETGTGKEVLAQYLHRKSDRSGGPFLAVNCSSLRGELLESELFGYKKGAFTGAAADRRGLFQAADKGTLFLDEIGEMDLNLQAKLLRVLESGAVRPVGAVAEQAVDVRIVAATHRDLERMVQEGSFRQDLYYRIAQMTVVLPPLRERGEDVLVLAYHFLERFKAKYPHKGVRDFHPDSLGALMAHEWPGNVRELANVVHRAVLAARGPLAALEPGTFQPRFSGLEEATKRFQKTYMERALILAKGNREEAARVLGMSRSTFFRYLSQLGVQS